LKKEVPRDEFIRKRMERQRRIRKRRLIAFFIFFIILSICVGITLSLTVFFPIEKINVKGSKIYSSEEILRFCDIEKGDNLFTVNSKSSEEKLRKSLPYVESIELERKLPNELTVKVKDAEEFACYKSGSRLYIVSKSGWVLKETDKIPKNIIGIKANGIKCEIGSMALFEDKEVKTVIDEITSALKEQNISINEIDITDTLSITVKVENRFEVELGNRNNITEKARHLAGMIKNIPEKKSGKINLSMWTSTNTQGTFTEKKGK